MTPITLVHRLADRIHEITKDYRMEESNGDHILRAPHVWEQNLPEKQYEDQPDPSDYPLVLVMLGGGSGITDNKAPCQIAVLVGAYDDGQPIDGKPDGIRDRQGWMWPAEIIWRIITTLAVNPVIGPFELDIKQLSWELPGQEQPEPQWYGIINMTWSVPIPKRKMLTGHEDFNKRPPMTAAMTELIDT